MFTIAQITDLHITTPDQGLNQTRNETRLRQTLAAINAMRPPPIAIIATGDLVDRGQAAEYDALKAVLCDLDLPIYLGLGNHDNRTNALTCFSTPQIERDPNGFVQYVHEFDGYRLIMCDTLDEGRETGAFCEQRAEWLGRTLADRPNTPTLIGLHHPPILSGIKWMDPDPRAEWITRLEQTLKPHSQVCAITSGHLHRAYVRRFSNTMVTVAPATSIQLTLDMTPIDLSVPDGREILCEEPPGYMIHMFNDGEITSHYCMTGPWPPAVLYKSPFKKS